MRRLFFSVLLCTMLFPTLALSLPRGQTQCNESDRRIRAFSGDLYAIAPNTPSLPDFSVIRPFSHITLHELNIPARNYTIAFPGSRGHLEWFAARFRGRFCAPTTGNYAFNLFSDDGSRLIIDNTVVINNDGIHSPAAVQGSVTLTQGIHDIVVEYYQGPADEIALQLFWTPPGAAESIFHLR